MYLEELGQSNRTTSIRTLMLVSEGKVDASDDIEVSPADQNDDSSVSLSAGNGSSK